MAIYQDKKEKPAEALPELDDIDLSILRLLQENARITVKEISERVHLSTTPVHERIKRLEQRGVIRQYATLLDHAKLRKGLKVICYVSLKEHNKKAGMAFIKSIQELPEVLECYNISGSFDFMLKVISRDMDDYYHFHVNKLSQIENVGNLQSVFVMGVIKETHKVL
ncbi:MAG TPA: AsnC family transcriptional regulator [Chitinophagaceae bacterium]|nr:AsnC family transcriptional regulator [Chitinophagaceae bacterium]HRF26828.1 Lrp/AsnC family transcriptional regulator [Ferruginibacter sp.]